MSTETKITIKDNMASKPAPVNPNREATGKKSNPKKGENKGKKNKPRNRKAGGIPNGPSSHRMALGINPSHSLKGDSLKKAYINTLVDPLNNPPVALGFGTFAQTQLATLYHKNLTVVQSSVKYGLFTLNPWAVFKNTTGTTVTAPITNRMNYWMTHNFYDQVVAMGALTQHTKVPTNINAVYNNLSRYRVVSAGMRVTITNAATAVPPYLGCARYLGYSYVTDMDGIDPVNVAANPAARVYPGAGGSATIHINWTPMDNSDYEFAIRDTNSGQSNGWNPLAICITGISAGDTIFCEAVTHVEFLNSNMAPFTVVEGDTSANMSNVFSSPETMSHAVREKVNFLTRSIEFASGAINSINMLSRLGMLVQTIYSNGGTPGGHYLAEEKKDEHAPDWDKLGELEIMISNFRTQLLKEKDIAKVTVLDQIDHLIDEFCVTRKSSSLASNSALRLN